MRTRLIDEEAERMRRRGWRLVSKVQRSPSGKFHWLVMDELEIVYAKGWERKHGLARMIARERVRELKAVYV
jgi:hypothetical protein